MIRTNLSFENAHQAICCLKKKAASLFVLFIPFFSSLLKLTLCSLGAASKFAQYPTPSKYIKVYSLIENDSILDSPYVAGGISP